ncbi:hypothetical protein LTR36_008539 [Oleoguttula mirabilis]|uniref:Tho complex subunit 7 n=1 Tax=Oleoguttula mirabilis TaxID=1507867 RepID=A0AAV9JUM1_9PEZI|nr:hypothetical protein LTR36_008539 [Oleoguttula mirabilis]
MAYAYGFLPDQAQEDALHATRLLGVEERPFQRVTRSLLSKDSLLRELPKQLPSPPPEGEEEQQQASAQDEAFKRLKFREEVLLDFAALESSILRVQLIQSSNQRERERYAAEKAKILETAQAVRDNTVELRGQLEEAQRMLELRKGYDELAGKILDDKKVKSRDECQTEIEKLEKEIEDLQHESGEYETTWVGRREQFDKVVAEGEAMVRLIKGIKDDPEAEKDDEGMEDGEEGTKGESSRTGTPAAGGRTPMPDGGETPMLGSGEAGDATPARPANRLLEIDDATRSSSRVASPSRHAAETPGDVEMAESALGTPAKTSMGMEASVAQVVVPAEGVTDTMDET